MLIMWGEWDTKSSVAQNMEVNANANVRTDIEEFLNWRNPPFTLLIALWRDEIIKLTFPPQQIDVSDGLI